MNADLRSGQVGFDPNFGCCMIVGRSPTITQPGYIDSSEAAEHDDTDFDLRKRPLQVPNFSSKINTKPTVIISVLPVERVL